MVKSVVIIGAGPSGLLLAHFLLRRQQPYHIVVYDRRHDPRKVEFSKSRTFPISLNERGLKALNQIPGLEAAVQAISLEMKGTIFHQQNGKTRITSRKKPLTTLDRTELTLELLNTLEQDFEQSQIEFHFNQDCTQVDLETKTVTLKNTLDSSITSRSYDYLIGADGAYSSVRKVFLESNFFEFEQKFTTNNYKTLFLPNPEHFGVDLQPDKIHSWRINDGTTVVLLHQKDGTMAGVILFSRNHPVIEQFSSAEAVLKFFQDHFPEVGQLMPGSEAEAFLNRPVARVLTVRCSHYHYQDSVLLIGDAAHAVSPSLGQGCNSALEDTVIFNNLLTEYGDNWQAALEQFTIRRKPDAHALLKLSDYAFPLSTSLFIEFVLRESLARRLHQLFPQQFLPALSDLLFETSVPYSEILKAKQGWIEKVEKSNQKMINAQG